MKKRGRFTLGQLLLSAVMVLLALTMLIPMLNILAKSFSDPALSPSMSGLRVIPAGFSTVNYDIVFSNKVILPTLWNSIFITVVGTAINIPLTILLAYPLSKKDLPGGNGVRVDTAAFDGYEISPYYDSMIAKIIVHGRDRTEAIAKMRTALEEMVVVGVKTNLDFQYAIMENETFAAGLADTSFIERFMKGEV